jgi:putative transposase
MRAAQDLGISAENIRRWKSHLDDGKLGSGVRQTAGSKLLQLKRMRKELTEVKMERDILRKSASILFSETQVKFEFIRLHRDLYPVENICKALGVSKSGYYSWNDRKPSKRALHNLALTEQIKIMHYRNKKRYGSPRRAGGLWLSCFRKTGQETDEAGITAECL